MSLASSGHAAHPVARKAVEFLVRSVRPDGSWAIDSDLSTWVTTLAINALETAINLGYRNFKHMSQDPDLKNLREHADYKRIRAKMRQMQVKTD